MGPVVFWIQRHAQPLEDKCLSFFSWARLSLIWAGNLLARWTPCFSSDVPWHAGHKRKFESCKLQQELPENLLPEQIRRMRHQFGKTSLFLSLSLSRSLARSLSLSLMTGFILNVFRLKAKLKPRLKASFWLFVTCGCWKDNSAKWRKKPIPVC